MKQKILVLLFSIFSLAAIGLIVVQIVQARYSSEVSDNLFNVSVNNSMEKVITQFDQMKIDQYLSQSERNRLRQYRRIEELNDKMLDIVREYSDLFYDEQRISFGVALQDSAFIRGGSRLSHADSIIIRRYNTLINAHHNLIEEATKGTNKTIDAPAEMLTTENFNYALLDSLIREELILGGVDITPAIGVVDNSTETFLYISRAEAEAELSSTSYRYNFLPSGIASAKEYSILLYFPTNVLLMFRDSRIFVYMSCFLIIIITILFLVAIRIISKLRKVDEMKTEFTNNMTHEIKTPIATIRLACEMLQDKSVNSSEESRSTFTNIIQEENQRMQMLIDTILQSAKMSNKNFSINRKELDLHEIVRNTAKSFKLALENRQGSLNLDLEAANATLFADKLHITNMVHNLIDNAIKYSPENPQIAIRTSSTAQSIIMKISDHGIGISKEDQKHIFEKFYRVSTGDVHNVKGFGIGLNYVFQVVKLHQGTITVESEPGEGSTFTITLPTA